jgi:integrase
MTLDMIKYIRVGMWRLGDLDACMTYLGVVLAFHFMLRVSEYVAGGVGHALLSEDVEFFLEDNKRKATWAVQGVSCGRICGAVLVVRSSKRDSEGKGRYLYLGRNSPDEGALLDDLISWCRMSGVKKGDPLFSRWMEGRRKCLTRKMVSKALKDTAKAFGLEEVFFSAHCLRSGGLTTQRVLGASRDNGKRVGGWGERSSVDEQYAVHTVNDRGTLAFVSSDAEGRLLDVGDNQRMLPLNRESPKASVRLGGRR